MEFEKKEEAQLAIDEMDGSQLLEQDISVTWAFVRGTFFKNFFCVYRGVGLSLGGVTVFLFFSSAAFFFHPSMQRLFCHKEHFGLSCVTTTLFACTIVF